MAKAVLVKATGTTYASTAEAIDHLGLSSFWDALAHAKPGFFSSLGWMAGGKELWAALVAAGHHPTILTGTPRGTWSQPQKKEWCRRELGEEVPVITCMAKAKPKQCKGPLCVLIDDNHKAEAGWVEKGGTFVLHRDVTSTLRKLRELGIIPKA